MTLLAVLLALISRFVFQKIYHRIPHSCCPCTRPDASYYTRIITGRQYSFVSYPRHCASYYRYQYPPGGDPSVTLCHIGNIIIVFCFYCMLYLKCACNFITQRYSKSVLCIWYMALLNQVILCCMAQLYLLHLQDMESC